MTRCRADAVLRLTRQRNSQFSIFNSQLKQYRSRFAKQRFLRASFLTHLLYQMVAQQAAGLAAS